MIEKSLFSIAEVEAGKKAKYSKFNESDNIKC